MPQNDERLKLLENELKKRGMGQYIPRLRQKFERRAKADSLKQRDIELTRKIKEAQLSKLKESPTYHEVITGKGDTLQLRKPKTVKEYIDQETIKKKKLTRADSSRFYKKDALSKIEKPFDPGEGLTLPLKTDKKTKRGKTTYTVEDGKTGEMVEVPKYIHDAQEKYNREKKAEIEAYARGKKKLRKSTDPLYPLKEPFRFDITPTRESLTKPKKKLKKPVNLGKGKPKLKGF